MTMLLPCPLHEENLWFTHNGMIMSLSRLRQLHDIYIRPALLMLAGELLWYSPKDGTFNKGFRGENEVAKQHVFLK